ncbi:hypothetical protein CYMTET_35519, partial [Cymbomonas tetramitiformis]
MLVVAQNGETSLWSPVEKGQAAVVESLLAKGADVSVANQAGVTVLHLAAGNGHKDVAERLVAKGADVSATDQ